MDKVKKIGMLVSFGYARRMKRAKVALAGRRFDRVLLMFMTIVLRNDREEGAMRRPLVFLQSYNYTLI
ncbi:MAG: hypothetical protein NC410_08270 [Oscillibacter sp.]|nr:hypothetical protein [Oscillibacter sp.]